MSDTAEAIAQARKAVEPDKPKHVLRTLGQSIREYKKASILAPVFVTVEGILEILIPTIMASLIDEGITGGSMPATVKFGVLLLPWYRLHWHQLRWYRPWAWSLSPSRFRTAQR